MMETAVSHEHKEEIQVMFHKIMDLLTSNILNNINNDNNNNNNSNNNNNNNKGGIGRSKKMETDVYHTNVKRKYKSCSTIPRTC